MKNGVLQNWGLVEFFDHNDAERTQQEIDGYNLKGSNIRVLYCIPGVNAINIYMSLVTSADTVSKKGLVDEVPSSTVYAQLQKLGTQNPACKYFIFRWIQTGSDPENYVVLWFYKCCIKINIPNLICCSGPCFLPMKAPIWLDQLRIHGQLSIILYFNLSFMSFKINVFQTDYIPFLCKYTTCIKHYTTSWMMKNKDIIMHYIV